MFNLIVSGGLESDRRGVIVGSRVFEHTSDENDTRFKPKGVLDTNAVLALPTILMREGTGAERVYLGWLTRVEKRGTEYQLQYAIDADLPTLTNHDVFDLKDKLEIDEWEFSRNHWATKDANLFEVLLKGNVRSRINPVVFKLSDRAINAKLISMMMPFSGSFNQVYTTVKVAIEAESFQCTRADDFWLHSHIIQDILELICTSRVVICDLSEKNPNVFYEAGIAHTLGKEVILITQSMNDVPFDLRALRCITYLNNQEGRDKLAADIIARLRSLL